MPIGITEDHEALRESAREMLATHCPAGAARAALEATAEELPAYWAPAADLGWFGLHVPEEYGGAGFGLLELAVVVEELGRSVAPGPFLPTVHASRCSRSKAVRSPRSCCPAWSTARPSATVALGATQGPGDRRPRWA